MSKTAVYLRVSTDDQSVASQRIEMVSFLRGKGIDPDSCRWFVDEGKSGATMNRPAMDKLRRAVEGGRIDTVVIYDLDRFARTMIGGLRLIDEWVRAGVSIRIVTFPVDLNSEVGPLIAAAYLWTAEHFLRRLKKGQAAGIKVAKSCCARCYRNGRERGAKVNIPLVNGACPNCGGTEVRSWGGRRPGRHKVDPRRVRDLAGKGLLQIDIARALGVSRRTVIRVLKTYQPT